MRAADLEAVAADDDDVDAHKRRRREGASWFNGRRGVRNFLGLAALCFVLFCGFVLTLPLDMQCTLLPESMCRGSCNAP